MWIAIGCPGVIIREWVWGWGMCNAYLNQKQRNERVGYNKLMITHNEMFNNNIIIFNININFKKINGRSSLAAWTN